MSMLDKVSIKNGQSIETDNCITTIIYILLFTVTIFMYQAQLINTEIKRTCNTYSRSFAYCKVYIQVGRFWRGNERIIYRFSISKFVLLVDPTPICLFISSFYSREKFVVYEINFELLIGFSLFSNIHLGWC
jgi:hypothetical protein